MSVTSVDTDRRSLVLVEARPDPRLDMGRAPSHNSSASLVTVDPAVAGHIVKLSKTEETRRSSSAGSNKDATARTNSRHVKEKGTIQKHGSTRQNVLKSRGNSLRRVRNSTEVLRQRTAKQEGSGDTFDGMSNTREGRNFTVGNVGTGGFLYLKPAATQTQHATRNSPLTFPLTPPKSAALMHDVTENANDNDKASESSIYPAKSFMSSTNLKRSTTNAGRNLGNPLGRPTHGRSYSFSSVDDRRSLDSRSGALRIVINRSTPIRSPATQNFSLTTLEVPIPHYRLGTPRFSTQGTAILRSSTHTRNSVAPSDTNRTSSFGQPDLLFPAPPGSKGHGLLASTEPEIGPDSSGSSTSNRPPLTPSLFDGLALLNDDASVVRYSAKTGQIMAATPARIVAQISSESFMDYELVSDFFLTFRLYMSTNKLLNLLLARLRWAINRLADDGRIVRIRTFAALRHWILNYFMDDFVLNRKLRICFCQQINALYAEVQARPNGGLSDLKILQDLKRCWNGRCSLYWDSPDFAIDSSIDREITPGGIVGSPHSSFSEPLMLDPEKEALAAAIENGTNPQIAESWFEQPPISRKGAGQRRESSAFAAFGPESPRSELSVQPNSCSLPMSLSRWPVATANPANGPHPVSVLMRRHKAPSNLAVSTKPVHSHLRNANSIDSSRTTTPVGTQEQRVIFASPYAGSLIRGQVLPPASAIVEVLSTLTSKSYSSKFSLDYSDPGHNKTTAPTSPAMKSIMGSIRRALGGKQGLGDITLINTPGSQHQGPLRGKVLSKTLASTKSHDELRKMVDSRPVRSQVRVDLLCAAAVQSYERAISSTSAGTRKQVVDPHSTTTTKYVVNRNIPEENRLDARLGTPRFYSQATAQSGSILIVDDTRTNIPSMSGALPISERGSFLKQDEERDSANAGMAISQSIYVDRPSAHTANQRSSGLFGMERSASASLATATAQPEKKKHWSSDPELSNTGTDEHLTTFQTTVGGQRRGITSTAASSVTMRRRGSFGSTIDHDEAQSSIGATGTSISSPQHGEDDDEEHAQSHTLRRRPGGDLKKIQHVHDLESMPRAQSFDSAIAATDSAGGSLVIMTNYATGTDDYANKPPEQKTVSMINTHSSQHLRPSFEAAIAGFSAIPDDDDGGLEATLLKLEGKYGPTSPVLAHETPNEPHDGHFVRDFGQVPRPGPTAEERDASMPRDLNTREDGREKVVFRLNDDLDVPQELLGGQESAWPIAATVDSYNLVPLLERDQTGESAHARRSQTTSRHHSALLPIPSENKLGHGSVHHLSSSRKTWNDEEFSRAGKHYQPATFLFPEPSASVRSFLLDEDENLSDLSSEISVDIINQVDVLDRPFSPMFAAPGTARSGLELPSHPLGHSSDPQLEAKAKLLQRFPPTPDPSPQLKQQGWNQPAGGISSAMIKGSQFSVPLNSNPGHMPFILAYDSQVLAQQLTLVEKAALSEVEWCDLVEMRWDNKAANVLDWVEYLSTKNNKGIDLVITRFNLVVKWVLSEIVLTQDINERARAITKYIHTAAYARRLHNYATMLQLTIALTSIDCTRLTKTWALISDPDRSLLKNMEALIQPVRNFHELRTEMESADLSDGCIPFIGLYIHDLTYNAQKPSQIAGTRESEPLVNFERYRTAATIIKGLLRLIDASSKYNITAVAGVTERCLWIAALDDPKLRALSKSLETQE